jgi:hypothetical protein
MILKGKGRVGKSFIAAEGHGPRLVFVTRNGWPICSGIRTVGVCRLKIMEGDEINSCNFDTLIELVTASASRIQQTLRCVEKPRAPISLSV